MTTSFSGPAATKQPRKSTAPLILVLAGLCVGAAAGYLSGRLLKAVPHPEFAPWALVLLPLVMLLVPAVHEAGHVLAGLLSGFRFHLFVAGPLRIHREGDRLRVGFNRIASLWGGLAACAPQHYEPQPLRRGMLLYAAGGPVASLLGIAALWPAYVLLGGHPNAALLLGTFGFISALIAIATLIPMHHNGYTSDGGRLLMLLRNRSDSARWLGVATLAGLSISERPSSWPEELLVLMGEGTDPTADAAMVCLLRHLWHVDRKEFDAARLWLERGLATADCIAAPLRGSLYTAAAWFFARRGGSSIAPRRYLELAEKPGIHSRDSLHLARAAVLISEGRATEAMPELDLAVKALRGKPAKAAAPAFEDIAQMRAMVALEP